MSLFEEDRNGFVASEKAAAGRETPGGGFRSYEKKSEYHAGFETQIRGVLNGAGAFGLNDVVVVASRD